MCACIQIETRIWIMVRKYQDWSCIYQDINFSPKYKLCLNVSRAKLYLPRQKWTMNETLIFLKNTKYVPKVSRLNLYLPRQKWTMNETLIFLQIRPVFKKYRDWSCIYQYSIWSNYFLPNTPFGTQHTYSGKHSNDPSIPVIQAFQWSKHLWNSTNFWCGLNLCLSFHLKVFRVRKSYSWDDFPV